MEVGSASLPVCREHKSACPQDRQCGVRTQTYLNNILEQDHRAIKHRVKAKQGFREFQAARRTIQGYEAVHMIRKGQVRWVAGDHLLRQIQFIDRLFALAN
jgi:IS6 family transposase